MVTELKSINEKEKLQKQIKQRELKTLKKELTRPKTLKEKHQHPLLYGYFDKWDQDESPK